MSPRKYNTSFSKKWFTLSVKLSTSGMFSSNGENDNVDRIFFGCMLVVDTDGGRHQRTLLARLDFVYSGAIGASDNPTLSSRNVDTPTDTFCAIWDANSGRTSPYQQ